MLDFYYGFLMVFISQMYLILAIITPTGYYIPLVLQWFLVTKIGNWILSQKYTCRCFLLFKKQVQFIKNGKLKQQILTAVLHVSSLLRIFFLSGVKLVHFSIHFIGIKGNIFKYDKKFKNFLCSQNNGFVFFLKHTRYKTKCRY